MAGELKGEMAPSGSREPGMLMAFDGNRSYGHKHRPRLQQGHRCRHGPKLQARPKCNHVSGRQHKSPTAASSLPVPFSSSNMPLSTAHESLALPFLHHIVAHNNGTRQVCECLPPTQSEQGLAGFNVIF